MSEYSQLSSGELSVLQEQLKSKYDGFKTMGLKLDMSRGKPGATQLSTTDAILDVLNSDSCPTTENGFDIRNYGLPDGIPECKRLFAQLLGIEPENVVVCGNSSLNIMFDYIAQCMTHGICGCEPWCRQGSVKFLCPVPGYDRHFKVLDYFGIEMINVPMLSSGPDMEIVEQFIKDSSVKGMFCVPKYSNPQGITFSDETVEKIAALKPAAKDFRIIWDNAYIIHDFTSTPDTLKEIFSACAKYGSEDMIIEVVSSSKMSYPGAGISAVAASQRNISEIKKRISIQTIGYDKINQMRHVMFFKDINGLKAHMKVQAEHLKPRFELVLKKFDREFSGKGIAQWTKPNGGYFINLVVPDGCAARVVALCSEAGVTLTGAGAAFPYGKDPDDSNIRIAPTYPSIEDLALAMEVLCVCVELAAIEQLLA